MIHKFDERQLIEELKETNWYGIRIQKLYVSKILRKTLIKYPDQGVNISAADELLELSKDDYKLFIQALVEYEMIDAFNDIWFIEHNWGLESIYKATIWELMDELSRRCSENFEYERIWEISRDIMTLMAKKHQSDRVAFIYTNVIPCLCKDCRAELNLPNYVKALYAAVWDRICLL